MDRISSRGGGSADVKVFANTGIDAGNAFNHHLHMAIGMFDGVHIGHQAVIRQAIEAARKPEGHYSAVLTFDPHPSRALYPEMATNLLFPLRQRIRDMHSTGIDLVFVQEFTREYARRDAGDFVPALKAVWPQLESIHVGENFRFGAGRKGNIDTLIQTSNPLGIDLHALKREVMDGIAISSSRIRAALIEGSIDEVNGMLGRPYTLSGRVIKGKGLGRTLDFPTLNIVWQPEVLPRLGVYRVYLQDMSTGQLRPGIANYGLRPTLDDSDEPLLEVHLLDREAMPVPGDEVSVQLLQFIRPEKQFESVDALRRQIAGDVEHVRQMEFPDHNGAK